MKHFLFFCLITSFTVSCRQKEEPSLAGVMWVVEKINGKEVKLRDNGKKAYLEFDEAFNRVSGKAGCNRFFGNYSQSKTELSFAEMGATRISCPDIYVEVMFFKMLEDTDSFSIKRNKLFLKEGSNIVAVFRAEKAE